MWEKQCTSTGRDSLCQRLEIPATMSTYRQRNLESSLDAALFISSHEIKNNNTWGFHSIFESGLWNLSRLYNAAFMYVWCIYRSIPCPTKDGLKSAKVNICVLCNEYVKVTSNYQILQSCQWTNLLKVDASDISYWFIKIITELF